MGLQIKLKLDEAVERYEDRLVAKGYNQVEGIDFNYSFSPAAKVARVRIILVVAAFFSWTLHQ